MTESAKKSDKKSSRKAKKIVKQITGRYRGNMPPSCFPEPMFDKLSETPDTSID